MPLTRVYSSGAAYIKYPQSSYYFGDRELELIAREDPALFRESVSFHSITEPFIRVFYQTSLVDAEAADDLDGFMRRSGYEVCDAREFGLDTVLVLYGWLALQCQGRASRV